MIKLTNLLKELGEGTSTPYQYTTDDDYYYYFTTHKGTQYEVEIMSRHIDHSYVNVIPPGKSLLMILVSFVADNDYSQSNVVNKGEMYRVMSTITKIVKENISNNPEIGGLYFSPTKKPSDSQDLDQNQRYKLYYAYVKRAIPTSQTLTRDGEVFILFQGWEDKLKEDQEEEDF